MRKRCYNPNCTAYDRYGGRGISICEEWQKFELFREWDMPQWKTVFSLSKLTIYVFLLHETTMGIFWYFKKCWNTLNYDPVPEFLFWSAMYIVGCFVFAALVHWIYTKFIESLWNRLIDKLCVSYETLVTNRH